MLAIIAIVLIVFGVVTAVVVRGHSGSGSSESAATITGWLHTDGTTIRSSGGNPVRLLGLDEPSLIAGEGNNEVTNPDACGHGWQQVPSNEYGQFAAMGFNSVRLGISWANLEPEPPTANTHHWNQAYLAALDQEVRGFTAAGVAVILDMHGNNASPAFKTPRSNRCEGSGLPAWLFPNAGSISAHQGECDFLTGVREPGAPIEPEAGYAEVWRMVASRYAANSLVVGADLYNEPSSHCDHLDLTSFYTRLGGAVRSANPHLLLICQDNTAKKGRYALTAAVPLPDVVYSFHVYANTSAQATALLDAHVQHVASWHVPIWLGEFGVLKSKQHSPTAAGGEVAAWANNVLPSMMDYCREHDMGWAFHQYAGGNAALIDPRTGKPRPELLAGLRAGF